MTRALLPIVLFALFHGNNAEISNGKMPEWYSANVISDPSYSPKPLTEIFTTEQTFSTRNPIVVLASSTQPPPLVSRDQTVSVPPPVTTSKSTQVPSSSPAATNPTSSTRNSPAPTTSAQTQTTLSSTTALPSSTRSSSMPSTLPQDLETQSQSQLPRTQPPQAPAASTTMAPVNASITRLPFIRIRMMAPSGAITNVNVNPQSTTTTRRPTTTRRNRRRNNYNACVDACGGRRTPICAAPLARIPIDPDTLKGFPSICHMACHNSFRRNPYEKVIDGRCGRLRTRIRTADSPGRLSRDELNRVQYTVVQNPGTIIEFQPAQ